MKKFLFILFGLFVVAGAFAAGENVPTSKSYVDAAVAQKQDKISANIIMPTGYTQLEYIESTGTQYIDTGIAVNNNIGISIDFLYSNSSTNEQILFGHVEPNFGFWRSRIFSYGFRASEGRTGSFETVNMTNRHVFELNFSNNGIAKLDDNIQQLPHDVFSTTQTIYMFSSNRNNRSYNPATACIFSAQMTNFTELVRNFIPARRNSDGVLGMYDTVTNTFFTNAGTGEFIAGPVIPGNKVLTNTGTAGEYGSKGIYDANGAYAAYAAQTQNLVDAATMNAGVQNAIDSEFQCIEWLDPNDHSSDCLLMEIRGTTGHSTKNLFNKNNLTRIHGWISRSGGTWNYTAGGYSIRIPCKPNTIYTACYNGNSTQAVLSFASTQSDDIPTNTDNYSIPCTTSIRYEHPTKDTPVTLITGPNDKWLIVQYNVAEPQNTDMANNLQIEEGAVATAYEPYKNLYIPAGE